ncbi:type I-E CRISPR-associated protein Cas5/CasD [Croceibacterium ferulae]|uniref:type I-E CRISPR-associated protein Cas5/CasD n=1 Tax=Croceibacterium ferulae TaxID=1854641 RepID=UPI000EADB7FD|nr:type I-E CRISPR-associated protein Cas5/CasD [Croceibacterium ferulae]
MKHRHIVLLLDAPLMSFGSEAVDAHAFVRDFPARSALTGLLANALGWERSDARALDGLQDRLIFGAARLEDGLRMKDFQTAKLSVNDRGWTTHGSPEGRTGSPATYQSPHIRHRYVDAQARVVVVLRLAEAASEPDLDQISSALDRPARPLFIGRKPFIPSTRLLQGNIFAADVANALGHAIAMFGKAHAYAQWPVAEGGKCDATTVELTDERNWRAGVHAGIRRVNEGLLDAMSLPA